MDEKQSHSEMENTLLSNKILKSDENTFRDTTINDTLAEEEKVVASVGLQSVQKDTFHETYLDSLEDGSDSPNLEDKPIETYKKVKLKRSHILKKLSPISLSSTPGSSTNIEGEIKTLATCDIKSLNIDIPDDIISNSIDLDSNETSSDSATCSPTPCKKVKLIRNPRLHSNILKSPIVSSENIIKENEMSNKRMETQLEEKVQVNTVEEISNSLKSHNNPIIDDNRNDMCDVVAQIDQLIGADNVPIIPDSTDLFIDNLEPSTSDKQMDLDLIDDLDSDIVLLPSSNAKTDVCKKPEVENDLVDIVEELNIMCSDTSPIVVDKVEKETQNKDVKCNEIDDNDQVDENFSLVLDDSSDEQKDTAENFQVSSEVNIDLVEENIDNTLTNVDDYTLNLEDKLVSVDDLEKKLLQVSAEVESLNEIEETRIANIGVDNSVLTEVEALIETNEQLEKNAKAQLYDESQYGLFVDPINDNFVDGSELKEKELFTKIPDQTTQLSQDNFVHNLEKKLTESTVEITKNNTCTGTNENVENIVDLVCDDEPVKEIENEEVLPKLTLTIKKSDIQMSPKPKHTEEHTELKTKTEVLEEIEESNSKRVPKITIKPIKKPAESESLDLTEETVQKTELEAIPKLLITKEKSPDSTFCYVKTVKKSMEASEDDASGKDLEILTETSETVEVDTVPKLTIKKSDDNKTAMHVVSSEASVDSVPKITIKTRKTHVEQTSVENEQTLLDIPKITIKTGKKTEIKEKSTLPKVESSITIPKLTIKGLKKNASVSAETVASTEDDEDKQKLIPDSKTASIDCADNISAANKSSLAAANMELIPTSLKESNKSELPSSDDFYDEEIEVIPSSTDNVTTVPKLSMRALKKSLQHEKETENILQEEKRSSLPKSATSKLIIKPLLNPEFLRNVDVAGSKVLFKTKRSDFHDSSPDLSSKTKNLPKTIDDSQLEVIDPVIQANLSGYNKSSKVSTCDTPKQFSLSSIKQSKTSFAPYDKPGPKSSKLLQTQVPEVQPFSQSKSHEDNLTKSDRIVLKINKDNESMKSQLITDNLLSESSQLEKITLKLSKEGGHPEILHSPTFPKAMLSSSSVLSTQSSSLKRMLSPETTIEPITIEPKKMKSSDLDYVCDSPDVSINIVQSELHVSKKLQKLSDDVTIVRVPTETIGKANMETSDSSSKLKDILLKMNLPHRIEMPDVDSSSSDDVKIVEIITPNTDPLNISNDESSSQDVMIVDDVILPSIEDDIEVKPISSPIIKKRGRPRKIPLEVRPELKEEPLIEESPPPPDTPENLSDDDAENTFEVISKRPYTRGGRRGSYRSRRGRGGRGSRGGRGAYKRRVEEKKSLSELKATITSEVTVALDKIDLDKKSILKLTKGDKEAVFLEEDTRMSADGELAENSHQLKPEITDESRSSSTTTENNRNKRGRLEILEIDQLKHVTGPEQIAEYTWANAGPYMLQEQVAQYLGVKSFKRKYPGLTRHAVDMQERDYIRENGLASEALCDMGLTAVLSSEILDIMFTDFQDKYEEYRKYQREKQAKDVTNKQRAMATSMADNDCREESLLTKAIRSAASWNSSLNKTRKEQRKCYLDMQSFTVMYPRNRRHLSVNTNPGDYPVALVPGQFSEYYKNYTSTEMKYLPLNTVMYGPVIQNRSIVSEIGHSDGSCSESESSSGSDSDSSDDSDSTTMDGISTPFTNPPPFTPESDTCKICITCSPKSRPTKSQLIYCAQCNAGIHPRCIDLTPEMMPYIQAYPWQCTDCKTCWQCRAPSDDDKMLFCDRCDRGYHIYCVGLRKVPNGRWHCQQCVSATSVQAMSVTPGIAN